MLTLDCVGITQFSVIRTIYCNVGLKCFFIYLNVFFVIVIFYISQSGVKCIYGVV